MDLARIVSVTALGCALLLAGCAKTTVVRSPSASRSSTSTTSPRPVPTAGKLVTVRKGDTLYKIASANGVSALDIAMWNRIAPPYTIHPGQTLRLSAPDAPSQASASPARPNPAQGSTAKPATGKPVTGKPVAGTTNPAAGKPGEAGKPGTAAKPPATVATKPGTSTVTDKPAGTSSPAAKPAPEAAFAWRWPADGSIVGRFIADDPTRQGIDIAGKNGAPVRAAADGVVVYSGAGLVGYGELIIIKHSEQWLSAYGHNRARLVNEGQRVKAGDQIAEMGRSGASRDMLHFEIRHNGKPQDPLSALPKR